jgi:hypothetical protein
MVDTKGHTDNTHTHRHAHTQTHTYTVRHARTYQNIHRCLQRMHLHACGHSATMHPDKDRESDDWDREGESKTQRDQQLSGLSSARVLRRNIQGGYQKVLAHALDLCYRSNI